MRKKNGVILYDGGIILLLVVVILGFVVLDVIIKFVSLINISAIFVKLALLKITIFR